MKHGLVLLLVLALCSLSSCAGNSEPQAHSRLLRYDLGESTLTTGEGRSVTYRVQGMLGLPDSRHCPIVVLLHGSHPIIKAAEDRYDIGFEYLAQSLSEQGNLVISMNVGINYSFENGEPTGNERTRQICDQQLALLRKAVEGDSSLFGYDLTDAGDFDQVILMGHSRAGLDVLEYASTAQQGIRIAGIVCVAPSMYKVLEASIPNVPIGIILPQMDGDVISMDGNDIYERIVSDAHYTQTSELIYLKAANHGYFNTQLTAPDLNHNEADLLKLMQPEKQRAFLTAYLSDFVQSVVSSGEPVFASTTELSSQVYDCDVLLRVHAGNGEQLYRADDEVPLTCIAGTTANREIASYLPAQNTLERFKMPGLSFHQYALEHVVWTGAGGITIPISADLTGYRFLDIDMALDSTNPKNQHGQTMTVHLQDAQEHTAVFHVDKTAAVLQWQEGEWLEFKDWDGNIELDYSTFTPLVTLRLPLSSVQNIQLDDVQSVSLTWDSSAGGSVMLRSITAVE